jgi:hypothetical protein
MKHKNEIETRIEEILFDERLGYSVATIFENAPLALIQLSLECELHTLEWVLGKKLTNMKILREQAAVKRRLSNIDIKKRKR